MAQLPKLSRDLLFELYEQLFGELGINNVLKKSAILIRSRVLVAVNGKYNHRAHRAHRERFSFSLCALWLNPILQGLELLWVRLWLKVGAFVDK